MATHSVASVDSSVASASPLQELSSKHLLLDGYLRREELAHQLCVSARTIDRWQTLRCGPPRVTIGRTILYNLDSVRQWLRSNEESAANRSSRKRQRRNLPIG
jgi:predicted DNA-binding transcriptional regulator AlpA